MFAMDAESEASVGLVLPATRVGEIYRRGDAEGECAGESKGLDVGETCNGEDVGGEDAEQ